MSGDIVDVIRESVSAYSAGQALGLDPDWSRRCACPAHNGRDRNMILDRDGPWAHCFVCGANMDVIGLARTVLHCSFQQAIQWANSAFSLGLDLSHDAVKPSAEAARTAKERRVREKEERHRREMDLFEDYLDMDGLLKWCEEVTERYAPTVPGQQWDWRFEVAMRQITEIREEREWLRLKSIRTR